HQRLRIGVNLDEVHVADAHRDHVVHGIAAAATRTDHFDARARIGIVYQLNHLTSSSTTHRQNSLIGPVLMPAAPFQKKSLTQSLNRERNRPNLPCRTLL